MPVATANPILGILLLDCIAGIVVFVSLVRIATTPASLWAHGRWSKVAWAIAAIWFIPTLSGWALPVAAIAASVHTRKLTKAAADSFAAQQGIPFAAGQPDQADGSGTGGGSR